MKLDEARDAWLDETETARYDLIASLPEQMVNDGDVVCVFGSKGGGIASWFSRNDKVAHTVSVENRDEYTVAQRRNFDFKLGATRSPFDPVHEMDYIIDEVKPQIVVLDLDADMFDADVIATLTRDNSSVEMIVVFYPEKWNQRCVHFEKWLTTWHEDDLRFAGDYRRKTMRTYVRP